MLERTKYLLFLFVLQCSPSLLIPLVQQNIVTTTVPQHLLELQTNHIQEIAPNNLRVNELLQQIDVKDTANKVISTINNVAINDEAKYTTQGPFANATAILNNTVLTNPSNDSISLLLTNTSANALKAENLMVLGNQNKLVNGSQKYVSNISPNATIASGGNDGNKNATSLNTNLKESINLETVAIEPLIEENILPELSIDDKADIAWRIDSPGKGKTKNQITLKNINSNSTILRKNNNKGIENNDDINENTKRNIFLLLNTGNIDGISVNSPTKKDDLQTNLGKNVIDNVNPGNSKLMNDLVNSTISNLLSKILQRKHNHTNLNNKHLFLILNSGSISNVHVESPVIENVDKSANLKTRSRRQLNDTNNSTVASVTLKPLSTPIIEMRSIPPDNSTVDEIVKEEAPDFRSMISDKINTLQKVSNAVATAIEPNTTIDNNLLMKLIPEPPPISIDLNQIPLNNMLGGAFSFIKRLKRNTAQNDTATTDIQTTKDHIVKACNETESKETDLKAKLLTHTRKSLANSIYNSLELYQRIELVCPLSVVFNLYTQQVLGKLAEEAAIDVLHQILSSFVTGKEGVSDFASRQISEMPIKLKLNLQMLHGKTKEFIEQLNNNVDAKRCSVS